MADSKLTGNAALLASWLAITDPKDALRAIIEHEDLLGYDPYFAELRRALLDTAERVANA